jgi:DNA-binding XRE family transcriptional regulator
MRLSAMLTGGLKSGFDYLHEIDHFVLVLVVCSVFVFLLLFLSFLIWLVCKAITHKFGAELRVPHILYFKIGYPKVKPVRSDRRKPPSVERKQTEFSNLLKRLRIKRGIKLYQLAESLDLTSPQLSELERGSIKPTAELVERIANCLGLPEQDRADLVSAAIQNSALD